MWLLVFFFSSPSYTDFFVPSSCPPYFLFSKTVSWLSCKTDRAPLIEEMNPSKYTELADGGIHASLYACLCVCERDGLSIVVTSSKDQSGKPAGRWGRGFSPPYLEKKLEDRSSLPLARVFLVMLK